MLYVVVAIIFLVTMIALAVKYSHRDFIFFVCLLVSTVLCLGAFACNNYYLDLLYSDLSETDYVDVEYIHCEPKSYKLEQLPENKDKYIERVNNSYRYCIKNNDGEYLIKNTSSWLSCNVDIVYTDAKEPCCVVKGGEKITTLTKKPSIWFNLFHWLAVKDYDIGDVVKEVKLGDVYTFYVPYSK